MADGEVWWTDDPKERRDYYMARGDPRWHIEDMRLRRCNNCGLLAQPEQKDLRLVPMLEEFRGRSGNFFAFKALEEQYQRKPICAASAKFFPEYAPTLDFPKWNALLALPMPDCPSFVQWVPGLSIRDHKEMLDRAFMVKHEADRDAAMLAREDQRDYQRDWDARERQRLDNERWAHVDKREDARDEDAEKRHRKEIRTFGYLIGGAMLLAAFVGAAATLFAAGWFSNGSTVVIQQPAVPTTIVQSTPVTLRTP
jgi:hypothetical protein